jgi:hypothetical protein
MTFIPWELQENQSELAGCVLAVEVTVLPWRLPCPGVCAAIGATQVSETSEYRRMNHGNEEDRSQADRAG